MVMLSADELTDAFQFILCTVFRGLFLIIFDQKIFMLNTGMCTV